jgi:Ribonuclease G/E
MSKEIYISSTPHETRLAIVEKEELTEIYYERENEYTLAGSIYNGRVTRVLPGMQSSFVDIGLERDAFLYITDFMEEAGDAADFDGAAAMDRAPRGDRPRTEGRSEGRSEGRGEGRGVGVGGVGAMGGIEIVDRVRRCRFRLRVWRKSLGVLLRRAMRRLRTRCWTRRRVLAGMKKRLVRVLRARMDSAGGVDVADGGGDVALRARVRRM